LWLSSHDGHKEIQENVVGVRLNKMPAANIEIPLLPSAEQKRIAAVLNRRLLADGEGRAFAG